MWVSGGRSGKLRIVGFWDLFKTMGWDPCTVVEGQDKKQAQDWTWEQLIIYLHGRKRSVASWEGAVV